MRLLRIIAGTSRGRCSALIIRFRCWSVSVRVCCGKSAKVQDYCLALLLALAFVISVDAEDGTKSSFLHPVLRFYSVDAGQVLDPMQQPSHELHIPEDFIAEWESHRSGSQGTHLPHWYRQCPLTAAYCAFVRFQYYLLLLPVPCCPPRWAA